MPRARVRERDILALLAEHNGAMELWLANLTAGVVRVAVPDGFGNAAGHVLDAECGPDWAAMRPLPAPAATLTLPPYAVAMLSAGA